MPPPSTPSSTRGGYDVSQRPRDRFADHQLRRENMTLLEKLTQHRIQIEEEATAYNTKFEEVGNRFEALEAKVGELQRQLEQQKREEERIHEKYKNDMEAFISSVKELLPKGDLRDEMEGIIISQPQKKSTESGRPAPASPSILSSVPNQSSRPKPIIGPPVQLQARPQPMAKNDNPFMIPPRKNAAPRPEKQVAKGHPMIRRSISQQRSSPESVDATPAPPHTGIPPRLNQGNTSLKNYYTTAGQTLSSYGNTEPKFEIDFIRTWICGMNESKVRQKLLDDLMQLHPSKRKAGGSIEVLCDWEELQDGLKRTGLWEVVTEKKESKKRKRILQPRGFDPRATVETGF